MPPPPVCLQGVFHKASSVQLRNLMRTSDDEGVRRACYEGTRAIGPAVAERFAEIVKLRNKWACVAGFENYYDMKVQVGRGERWRGGGERG